MAESRFYHSTDGLKLHFDDYRPAAAEARWPAICLPGLTRTADDFRPLAEALSHASATPRRVVAFDYRGRGQSQWGDDWRRYSLATERADILLGLEGIGIHRAHIIGTSRGGLHIMGLAEAHRAIIQSAVFNDIGPILEPEGLARIKSYVGRPANPRSIAEAIAVLKIGSGRDFDGLSADEWRFFAGTTFGVDETRLGLRYDPQLARTLDAFDLTKPLPDSWGLFDKLDGLPTLTIRGAKSDLLSEATLTKIASRWSGIETMTVPGQGHAPLLADEATIARIDRFLAAAD